MSRIFDELTYLRQNIKRKKEDWLVKYGKGTVVQQPVIDVFSKSITCGEVQRCDIVIYYLAIENYYGQNDYGFTLYEKMQKDKNLHVCDMEQFKKLIKFCEEENYARGGANIYSFGQKFEFDRRSILFSTWDVFWMENNIGVGI